MKPEIAARYQKTYQRFIDEVPDHFTPLSFDIPPDGEGCLSSRAWFGRNLITSKRFYAEVRGGKRLKLTVLWMISAGFTIPAFLIVTLDPMGYMFGIPHLAWLLIFPLVALIARRISRKAPRKENHIFERETGKLYLWHSHGQPHVPVDFYDQFFFVTEGHQNVSRYGTLNIYVKDQEGRGEHFKGGHVLRLAFVGSQEEALDAWYFLVRYMDKDWPFNQEEIDFFDHVAKEKEKMGYKVGDVSEDGSVNYI